MSHKETMFSQTLGNPVRQTHKTVFSQNFSCLSRDLQEKFKGSQLLNNRYIKPLETSVKGVAIFRKFFVGYSSIFIKVL